MGILSTELSKDANGRVISQPSAYDPDKKTKNAIAKVLHDFSQSKLIQTKSYKEFNDMSLIQRMNKDQRSFNAWQEPKSNDPDEEWKSRAVRPIVRNKIISIAAHITANLIFPKVFAQNKNDELDNDAAQVMKDMIEWWSDESNYEENFLFAVVGALVNPAAIVYTEYAQTFRNIKETNADGTWTVKRVMDELYSGFKNIVVPVDEFFIENIYEHDVQKQGHIIWRRVISYSSAQAKYNSNETFKTYVRPGVHAMFDSAGDCFYEQADENMSQDQVEEVIYWNRNQDERLVIINGVMVSHPEQPNPRTDKKYPFAKTGYELFDEGKFFYYRSLANKTSVDEEVVNVLYRMVIDGTYLQLMPPSAVFGDEEIDSSIIAPGTVTGFDKDSKVQRIDVGNNISDGRATLEKVESSISESSVDKLQGGQSQQGTPPTAFELSRVEQNARIMLGLFGKMIGFLVKQWGELAVSDITQFATVADYTQITSESGALKFRNIVIPETTSGDGTKRSKKIEFDYDLPTNPSKREIVKRSFRILEKEGGMDSKHEVSIVNPRAFRELKFKLKITPDIITPVSENVEKALNLEAYDRAIASPQANQEALYRDLLLGSYSKTKDNPDKYVINKEEGPAEGQLAKMIGAKGSPQQNEKNTTMANAGQA